LCACVVGSRMADPHCTTLLEGATRPRCKACWPAVLPSIKPW
jgi:hypothetical protein